MKILLATDVYLPVINGVVTSVVNLRDQLRQMGHDVRVLTLSNTGRFHQKEHIYYLGSVPVKIYPNARVSVALFHPFVREILRWRPDVVHTQTEFTTFFVSKQIAKKTGALWVHTYHTLYEKYTHYFTKNCRLGQKFVANLSRMILSKVDGIVVPTHKVYETLRDYGIAARIYEVPTGICLENFQQTLSLEQRTALRAALGLSPEDIVLVTVGRLGAEKNVQELISFLRSGGKVGRRVKLLIVGDGPNRSRLENLVQSLELQGRVFFAGMAPMQEVWRYYQLGDIFVNASTSETQGLVYIEALASGLPLLCRQDECLRSVLENNMNGYTYLDEDEFTVRLQLLLEHPQRMLRMSENARKTAQKFSAKQFGEKIVHVYQAQSKAEKGWPVLLRGQGSPCGQ